jgi:hypothetical protein
MKMTDNEIKRALEYCLEQGITSECERCRDKIGCRDTLLTNALDLINRRDAENEEIKCRNQILTSENKNLTFDLKSAKAEIEELRKGLDIWTDIAHRETQYVEQAKTEAYKEFAERAKEVIVYDAIRRYSDANGISYALEDMVSEDIDIILMELTEVSDK